MAVEVRHVSRLGLGKVSVSTYIKSIAVSHQRVMQQVSIDLVPNNVSPPRSLPRPCTPPSQTHLWLDQNQVDEQHDKIMLDIFITKVPAVATHRQPDVVAARLIARARVLRP